MENLRRAILEFVRKREWQRYHSPKNLAASLSIEAAELQEIFLWLDNDESYNLTEEQLFRLREEIGDVMINLVNLATKFNIDPTECAMKKLEKIAANYPEDLARGNAKKYTEL